MKRASIAIALLIAGFIAGLVLTGRLRSAEESVAQSVPRPSQAVATRASLSAGNLPDLTGIASQAVKAVVNISSVQVIRRPNSPFVNDPFFEYFFGGRDDVFGSRDQLARSLGSGVLISEDGYVVTNSHVIGSEKAEITVIFADNHEAPARIVGIDKATDLALVKVAKPSLPPLRWADSSRAKVAEWVLAIGNPFGVLNQTVTLGIVSATGRSLEGRLAQYEDFIQTDAAINPGNSGGALINARGAHRHPRASPVERGLSGHGFAIPSNLARRIISDHRARRGPPQPARGHAVVSARNHLAQ
jgi:S1-C subfamily serine protease